MQPDPDAELSDYLAHGPYVGPLVSLALSLQNLWGRIGLIAHISCRVEAVAVEFGQSQINDHSSVSAMLHLEEIIRGEEKYIYTVCIPILSYTHTHKPIWAFPNAFHTWCCLPTHHDIVRLEVLVDDVFAM